MICYITAVCITACSLALAGRLIRQKIPMYYKMPMGAVCCFALQLLSSIVNEACGASFFGDAGVGAFGIFGGFCFLLSANFGQLDSLVDDGSGSKKARMLALAAPVIHAVPIAALLFTLDSEITVFNKLLFVVILLPILPASYFCLKHLLLPVDAFGFLRSSRLYNITVLAEGLLYICYLRALMSDSDIYQNIGSVVTAVSVFCLVLSCRKGVKIWKQLF